MTTAPVFRADLPREALTALIDAAPVRTGPLSQRPDGPRRSLDGAERESLARAGLVTETGASDIGTLIAEVLAAPRSLVTLAVWNDETEGRTTIAFPGTPAGGAGIVANGMEDRFLLAGPFDEADVAPLAEPVIAVLPIELRTPFEAVLDVEHMVVLATVLDIVARRDLRDPISSCVVTVRRIADWLSIWWGASDRSDLSGQIFAMTLIPDPPGAETVAECLADLEEAGLFVRSGDDRFGLSSAVHELAQILSSCACGLDVERLDIAQDGQLTGQIWHVLAGPEGGFLIETKATDRIGLTVCDRITAAAKLAATLAAPHPRGTRVQDVTGEIELVQHVGGPRFCAHCGKPIEPAWKYCRYCGRPIATGERR